MRGSFASSSDSSLRGRADVRRANRGLAPSNVLPVVVICLFASLNPRSIEASSATTSQVVQPGERSPRWYGFEIGPTFSLPLPAASANRDVIGLDAGLSCTVKSAPHLGLGADVAYHYWPASAKFKQTFNRFMYEQTFGTLELGEGVWGLQVIQVGGHIRVAAPEARGARPWVQVGISDYHIDPNTTGYSGDAGFFQITAPPLKRTRRLGLSVALGADVSVGRHARLGLDATYHVVSCHDLYGEDLQVFTLGTRLLSSW
jgi:hypothetical protein